MRAVKKVIAILLVVLFCSYPLQAYANEQEENDITQEERNTEKEFEEEPIAQEEQKEEIPTIEEEEVGNNSISKEDCIPIIVDEVPYEKLTTNTRAIIGQWLQEANGRWWFRYNDGTYPKSCWAFIYGEWYYFDSAGYLVVNQWLQQGGLWYHVNKDGVMARGWRFIGTAWYYFNTSGVMQQGWLQQGSSWYYLIPGHGVMVQNAWRQIDGKWYHFNSSGVMRTGEFREGNIIYRFLSNGVLDNNFRQLYIAKRSQEKTNWCWIACSQMMGQYYGRSNTQNEIHYAVKGNYNNTSGMPNTILAAIQYASGIQHNWDMSPLSLSHIKSLINGTKPSVICMRWNNSLSYHNLVLSGYKNEKVCLVDPTQGAPTEFYKYEELTNDIEIYSGRGKYTQTWYRK